MDKNSIQVGLAAFGMSGMVFHAPLLSANSGFILKKIVERSGVKAKELYPGVEVVKSFDLLLEDDAVELVVVNTPNDLHFEMGRKALQAGKHVVMEKPFTVTSQEAQTLIDIASEKELILSVFQNRRWDGDFLTVRKVIEQKLLGKLVGYEAHYDRFRNEIEANTWKEENVPGSGILYNLGSHMIDQALILFGKPASVMAKLDIQRPGGRVLDYYHILLNYPKVQVLLKSSYLVREPEPRYILHGTEGSFIKYGIDPQEDALKAGVLPGTPDWGQESQTDWGKINTQLNDLHVTGTIETIPGFYQGFYNNIYGAIREGKELAVKPEESLLGIRVIEAALESNSKGCAIEL